MTQLSGTTPVNAQTPRPYFIPAGLDFEALPPAVQLAAAELVQPAYDELVLQATGALERAAGSSFVCLMFFELLEQCELGRQVADQIEQGAPNPSPREEDFQRHLRLIGAKGKAGEFLLRLRQFRAKHIDPFVRPAPK